MKSIVEILEEHGVPSTQGAIMAMKEYAAAEVDRRIAERMPSEEELNKEANTYGRLVKENLGNNFMDYGVEENASLDFLRGAAWCRSRLTNDSQKTEGGE